MVSPTLQRAPVSPKMPPPDPSLVDRYFKQAQGRLMGPAERAAQLRNIEAEMAKEALEIAEDEAALAADAEVSTGTAAGVDEIPIAGEFVMAGEAGYAIYKGARLARALKRAAELAAMLAALEQLTNVQVQDEEQKKKDCSKATS